MRATEKWMWGVLLGAMLALVLACVNGCATVDRAAYQQEVTWTNVPVVRVHTNTVVVTNTMAVVTGEPAATNFVTALVTNLVPVFMTNVVQVPITNLVEKAEALAAIGATGSIANTLAPGIGSILALALGGLYHGYRQLRNRKVNEALIQGVETARAVLTTTPQGREADALFVKWLMEHQKEAGVFVTVSDLVQQLSDNPAARLTAQEIGERIERACSEAASAGPGRSA
jgi:hypothetical protein